MTIKTFLKAFTEMCCDIDIYIYTQRGSETIFLVFCIMYSWLPKAWKKDVQNDLLLAVVAVFTALVDTAPF